MSRRGVLSLGAMTVPLPVIDPFARSEQCLYRQFDHFARVASPPSHRRVRLISLSVPGDMHSTLPGDHRSTSLARFGSAFRRCGRPQVAEAEKLDRGRPFFRPGRIQKR
jgi:hypothetical protein